MTDRDNQSVYQIVDLASDNYPIDSGSVELLTDTPKLVGYWTSPLYPEHDAEEIYVAGFQLPHPQDCIDPEWDSDERNRVIDYLDAGTCFIGYWGYSYCRMGCEGNDREMGASDLTDGVWIYPEGYSHYLKVHDVKPPAAFLDHIEKNEYKQPQLKKIEQSEVAEIRAIKEAEQLSRERAGPRITESEIDEIVRTGTKKKLHTKPWWRFW